MVRKIKTITKRRNSLFWRKVASDKRLENTIASQFYFVAEMGPSISSVSVVAFFVTTDASVSKLTIMFIFGIGVRYFARRLKNSFYLLMDDIKKKRERRERERGIK